MPTPKKVLFCYISPSSGHQRAAEAVMNVFRHRSPPVPCEGVSSISYANPVVGKIVSQIYLHMLKLAPGVWDYLYDNPAVERATRDVRDLLHLFNTRRIVETLKAHRPRVLVCTQAVPMELLSALKARGRLRMPLVGIITDFGVHKYWISPHVDLYLVPSEEVRRRITRLGVAESRVRVTGIPIDPHFAARGDPRAERLALGLSPHRSTVLFMGGSYGLGPLADGVRALRRLPLDLQFIVVCGTNRGLMRQAHERFRGEARVRILGQTRAVPRLMDAADLLVSKPGGLTSSEALAKGLPLVIFRCIPGQEEWNASYLLRHGAAQRADDLEELVETVRGLFLHPARRERMRENARLLARPWAAHDAAEAILSLDARGEGRVSRTAARA